MISGGNNCAWKIVRKKIDVLEDKGMKWAHNVLGKRASTSASPND